MSTEMSQTLIKSTAPAKSAVNAPDPRRPLHAHSSGGRLTELPDESPGLRLHQPAERSRVSPAALSMALDMLPEAVLFCSAELRVIDANAAAVEGSGLSHTELQSSDLAKLFTADSCGQWDSFLARLRQGDMPASPVHALMRSVGGEPLPVIIRAQFVEGHESSTLLIVARLRAESTDLDAALSMAANRDFLTDLPTRSALEFHLRRLERRARQSDRRVAVLFVDVDRLKVVNDTLGHRAGDAVLRTISRRLAACVRPGDFVARYGGDEFVALVEDVPTDEEVERIAMRVREELVVSVDAAGVEMQVSASVGVAVGHCQCSPDTLVDEADRAMYLAKRGRD